MRSRAVAKDPVGQTGGCYDASVHRHAISGGIALLVWGCGLSVVGVAPDGLDAAAPPSDAAPAPALDAASSEVSEDVKPSVDSAPPPCTASGSTIECCAGSPCPAGTMACTSTGACTVTLHVQVNVDGQTDLVLKGPNLFWHHYRYVHPGVAKVNGAEWNSVWPSGIDRDCDCDSAPTMLPAPLPAKAQTIAFQNDTTDPGADPVGLQQPSDGNQFVAKVRFDDDSSGAHDYDVTVTYETR